MKSKHLRKISMGSPCWSLLRLVTSGGIVCYPITATSRFWMCHTICWMVLCQAFLSLLPLPHPPSKISSPLPLRKAWYSGYCWPPRKVTALQVVRTSFLCPRPNLVPRALFPGDAVVPDLVSPRPHLCSFESLIYTVQPISDPTMHIFFFHSAIFDLWKYSCWAKYYVGMCGPIVLPRV